jgi:hypothetical protein
MLPKESSNHLSTTWQEWHMNNPRMVWPISCISLILMSNRTKPGSVLSTENANIEAKSFAQVIKNFTHANLMSTDMAVSRYIRIMGTKNVTTTMPFRHTHLSCLKYMVSTSIWSRGVNIWHYLRQDMSNIVLWIPLDARKMGKESPGTDPTQSWGNFSNSAADQAASECREWFCWQTPSFTRRFKSRTSMQGDTYGFRISSSCLHE